MATTRTVSLSNEINLKLKEVPNASGLIECLLQEYFKTNIKDPEQLLARKIQVEEEKTKMIELKQKEVEKIEKDLSEVSKSKADEEADIILHAQKMADKISECVNNTKDMFDIDITPEDALELELGIKEVVEEGGEDEPDVPE